MCAYCSVCMCMVCVYVCVCMRCPRMCVTSFKTGDGGSGYLSLTRPMLLKLSVQRKGKFTSHNAALASFGISVLLALLPLVYDVSCEAFAGQIPCL